MNVDSRSDGMGRCRLGPWNDGGTVRLFYGAYYSAYVGVLSSFEDAEVVYLVNVSENLDVLFG